MNPFTRTIETSLDIGATPDEVWSALVDFPGHAGWNPLFASIEGEAVVGERLRVTQRRDDGGRPVVFSPTVVTAEPGCRLVWRGRLFAPGLFDGTHTYELHPTGGGGTRFVHRERFVGALVPVLSRVVTETEAAFGRFDQALADRTVGCGATACEAGA